MQCEKSTISVTVPGRNRRLFRKSIIKNNIGQNLCSLTKSAFELRSLYTLERPSPAFL